ncbi:ArsR family transcriptional regulator [Solwaraspora sp. WMMD1047]|uniref:arsenate reductase/protein-tyrosine-phosphatase family protein n=1 Tax=Solwaraspora sp. WMMD1047 TaxID=3016102 RepID=UPI0024164569|nr:ArsR family transcriptional regulator [Solwaraspora sp. WMMD1047]MDG4828751.1 ArsR family transcriptional regulator [Solwaraspora sp. WMMD1047]
MAPTGQAAAPPFVQLAAHPLRWALLTELARSDLRVRELVALVGQPQNLVSYHLRLLRDGGLVTATRSSFDGRDSYYHLDLDRCATALTDAGTALHPALHPTPRPASPAAPVPPSGRPRAAVLFVCTGNSARSPIAAALLRHRAGGRVEVASAGTQPRQRIHPNVVRVLRERYGIATVESRPRQLESLADRRFDHLVTLCDRAREACRHLAGPPSRTHWSIPDPVPAGATDQASYPAFQRTAADIDTRLRHLMPTLDTDAHQEVRP